MGLMTVLPHRAVIRIQYDEVCKEFGIVLSTEQMLNKCFFLSKVTQALPLAVFFLAPRWQQRPLQSMKVLRGPLAAHSQLSCPNSHREV